MAHHRAEKTIARGAFWLAIVLGLVLSASGCTTFKGVSPEVEARARHFEASPDHALVYFYGLTFPTSGCEAAVAGIEAHVPRFAFFVAKVEPGAHLLTLACSTSDWRFAFDAEAGGIYFVEYGGDLLISAPRFVDAERGRRAIAERRMIWTSQLPLDAKAPFSRAPAP